MTRVKLSWEHIHSSLWFIPTVLTLSAVGMATLTVWIDQHHFNPSRSSWFILVSGAEGARGVLATIAGSIITVTGVVFSITIVVLQLASSQYSPRVLRSFTGDRVNQTVLGVFIGTFTYALLVLRTVRSEIDDYDRFVPSLSVNVAVVLALVSMGFLIYYIDHIARAIQAETIVARVTHDALQVVEKLFPDELGEDAADGALTHDYGSTTPALVVRADGSGFVQSVDEDSIMAYAEEHDLVLRLEQPIGAFIIDGDPLVAVMHAPPPAAADELRRMIQLGVERTPYQDVERGLIELTDIAVRALSPGINDPTTAVACINRLTEVFTALGRRRFPEAARVGKDGRVRVIARPPQFDRLVRLAYGQIREHGARISTVADRLTGSLERLIARLPPRRHPVLREEIALTRQAASPPAGAAAG